jgi:hypothetical protein
LINSLISPLFLQELENLKKSSAPKTKYEIQTLSYGFKIVIRSTKNLELWRGNKFIRNASSRKKLIEEMHKIVNGVTR